MLHLIETIELPTRYFNVLVHIEGKEYGCRLSYQEIAVIDHLTGFQRQRYVDGLLAAAVEGNCVLSILGGIDGYTRELIRLGIQKFLPMGNKETTTLGA